MKAYKSIVMVTLSFHNVVRNEITSELKTPVYLVNLYRIIVLKKYFMKR